MIYEYHDGITEVTEAEAKAILSTGRTVMRRLVGEWEVVNGRSSTS